MFRTIKNIIEGRIKTHDKILSIEEALTLLDGLDGNVRGDIHQYEYVSFGMFLTSGSGWEKVSTLPKVPPRVMVNFVNFKFDKENEERYTNIRHQVYSGGRGEKHYLDFARGEIKKEYGVVKKESPYTKVSIEFIVEKLS